MNTPGEATPWRRAWRRFFRHKTASAALAGLAALVAFAIVAPWLSPFDALNPDWERISAPPEPIHPFGTDSIGRDLLVRTALGLRMTLVVAGSAALIALLIGLPLGMIAGYRGGWVDLMLMRTVDVLYALPFLFLAIVLVVLFGRRSELIFLAIGAYVWLDLARVVRAETLSLREREFVLAARALGAGTGWILLRHILPQLSGSALATLAVIVPKIVLIESFLSYLGLGLQEPLVSLGGLVNEGAQDMGFAPWALLFPAAFLSTLLLVFHFLAEGLRDAFDPREAR
jgi:oligopeptide transport system permease protein